MNNSAEGLEDKLRRGFRKESKRQRWKIEDIRKSEEQYRPAMICLIEIIKTSKEKEQRKW